MEKEIERMYYEYSDNVHRYIYWLVGNKETSEDLTQDTFYRAFKKYDSFRKNSTELTWLLKIARNITYDYFRKKKLAKFLNMDSDFPSTFLNPEEKIIKNDEISALYEAMKSIKKDYRDVILIRKISECSVKDTAYILGWTEAKVKMKLTRAIAALKKQIIREGEVENGEFTGS